jgi:hypothetical protein
VLPPQDALKSTAVGHWLFLTQAGEIDIVTAKAATGVSISIGSCKQQKVTHC